MRIDSLMVAEEDSFTEALVRQLDTREYDALIALPFYIEDARAISASYPSLDVWSIATLQSAEAHAEHTLLFDRRDAFIELATYLSEGYQEFESALLFLVAPQGEHEAMIINEFEDLLIESGLNFDLERISVPNDARLAPYIEQINNGAYNLVGLFLREYNYLVYDALENNDIEIISEHLGAIDPYYHQNRITASIEYNYERALQAIFEAIGNDDDARALTLNADLIFY